MCKRCSILPCLAAADDKRPLSDMRNAVPALALMAAGALTAACATSSGCTPGRVPTISAQTFRIPERPTCAAQVGAPEVAGQLATDALVEVSGVVASARTAGVLWMHNDSGDSARVFAVTTRGEVLGTLSLPGVEAQDIEDIATGPCPDLTMPCLYLADTGDNERQRESLVVLAVPEPEVSPDKPPFGSTTADVIWRFPVRIPKEAGGPADVEAMVVLPDASAILLLEKAEGEARILRYPTPWIPEVLTDLEQAGRLVPPGPPGPPDERSVITGADIHPSGKRLLLRTYRGVFEAVLDPLNERTAERVSREDFRALVLDDLHEPQGEAVAYDAEGTGYWTISELIDGAGSQPLYHAVCR